MEQPHMASAPTSAQLTYHPFPDKRHFRLLSVASQSSESSGVVYTLQTFPLNNAPSYAALSYTWGSAIIEDYESEDDGVENDENENEAPGCSESNSQIIIDGNQVQVTENLLHFLMQWTREDGFLGSKFVWIDALCINQMDLSERSSQVQQMGKTFSCAEQVVIWLGRDTSDLDDFIWLHENLLPLVLQEPNQQGETLMARDRYDPEILEALEVSSSMSLDTRLHSYYRFCDRRRWFSRVWVRQEYVLAAERTFLCGSARLPQYYDMVHLANFFTFSSWFVPLAAFGKSPQFLNRSLGFHFSILVAIENALGQMLRGDQMWSDAKITGGCETLMSSGYFLLEYLIQLSRPCEAKDGRDKIYGLLGLAESCLPAGISLIIADYTKSMQEVFVSAGALLICNIPSLTTLSLTGINEPRTRPDLPS